MFQRDGVVASKVEALVEIANRSLDTITDPARRDRYRVHVHLDVDNTMLDGLGYHLPEWLRDLICCDSFVSTVNEMRWDPGQCRTHPAHRPGTHPPPAWCCVTAGVACRGARRISSCMSITSSTGIPTTATARPTRGIWRACVRGITGCITKAASGSPATPTTRTD